MRRKIQQIAVTNATHGAWNICVVFALADDGTLWRGERRVKKEKRPFEWELIPALPDDVSNLQRMK